MSNRTFSSRAAFFAVLTLAFSPLARSQAPAPAKEAEVIEVENVVEARKAAVSKWAAAPKGTKLVTKDKVRTGEFSRAVVRLLDTSLLRMDELTDIEIKESGQNGTLEVKEGNGYFFSRERQPELNIRTPAANGALRGTCLIVSVRKGKSRFTLLEGELEMSNSKGSITLRAGEAGEAVPGQAPRKTAMIEARNIIQWCLYYPAVLDLAEIGLGAADERAAAASVAAYREGDLLGALEKYPKGLRPGSTAGRLYRAGVMLAVGRVDEAEASLAAVPRGTAGRRAIEEMIAAVNFDDYAGAEEPATAGEWIARSYYEQSKSRLEPALAAAKKAAELSPENGYAQTRVAELQFSFGRTEDALAALERGLELTPRNAQAHALRGFLLSAQNKIKEARASFEEAIALDGALANAWLGRGLTFIREGHDEDGRRDLQTAATLEPTRSILHAYLGKAFSQEGDNVSARKDLTRAKDLDPRDPTPWLYSAIQNRQENRYNAAIRDLEKSIELNDNRRVYRSRFLLDQDEAIRGANLASIYENNGMVDQSFREAIRAVNADYSSAPAHLFLSNSYDALRDPSRVQLRYETGWFNELLLAYLLSPVGGGPLSQFVSQQEYSKLFEADGLGFNSVTDVFSDGELRAVGSLYGTFGNMSFALDSEYRYHNGKRPNNRISDLVNYASIKLQITPRDTLYFQTKFEELRSGDNFQRYDQRDVDRESSIEVPDGKGGLRKQEIRNRSALTFDFRERQDPGLMLLGWHHQWSPENHTLLLLGRLANDQVITSADAKQFLLLREVPGRSSNGLTELLPTYDSSDPRQRRAAQKHLSGFAGKGRIIDEAVQPFDIEYRANFETYTADLSQIMTLGDHTLVFGGRYQRGQFETQAVFNDFTNGTDPGLSLLIPEQPIEQRAVVDFERINLHIYETWRVAPWLTLTGGVVWDSLRFPDNFRSIPINDRQRSMDKVSPKAGFILEPWRGGVVRGAYAQGLTGTSFDESVRLEPTQVAGFTQAFRTLASESLLGSVAGTEQEFWGISIEQKFKTGTYLGATYDVRKQDFDRTFGAFDFYSPEGGGIIGGVPSEFKEEISYREDVLTLTINQLVGENWSLGARYRGTKSELDQDRAGFRDAIDRAAFETQLKLAPLARVRSRATLHELSLFALYNHASGFFARAEANWYNQENDSFVDGFDPDDTARARAGTLRPTTRTYNTGPDGDSFWHLNVFAGYRFNRGQGEVSVGLLNMTGEDYMLNPLNPYLDLPRDRTLVVRCRLSF